MPETTPDIGFPIRIDVFSQFADLLGKVGQNIAKLVTEIKEAAATGRALYRSWHEESRLEDLVRLRRNLVIHNNKNNQELLRRINNFMDGPSDSNWGLVRQHIDETVSPFLIELVKAVEDEDGAWALESSYKDIVTVLQARSGMIVELKSLDTPSTPQEMDGLARLAVRYQEIMVQLDAVSDALAAYIKAFPKGAPTIALAMQESSPAVTGEMTTTRRRTKRRPVQKS